MSDSVPEAEPRTPAAAPGEPAAQQPAGPAGPVAGEPFAPAPLGVPRTPTGDADVDAALERLGDADHLGTDGHLEVYEDVHGGLRDALTALDTRPGPPGPQGPPAPSAPSPPYRHRS
ncbi:hypothetical protein ACFUCQ_25960 [Streptomyces sp. NPDC057197]|uniref:hypothetical protein n=1 Tax=Streptomyces sp. NPDC057197 TaxID=3346045 RepID=UPI0036416EC4